MIAQAALDPVDRAALVVAGGGLLALGYVVWRRLSGRSFLPASGEPVEAEAAGPLLGWALLLFVVYQVGAGLTVAPGLGTGAAVAGIVVALGACLLVYVHAVSPLMSPRGTRAQRIGVGLLFLWAALPAIQGSFLLFQQLGYESVQEQVKVISQRRPGWPAMVFLAVVVAPVAEELCFRGLLYPALRKRWGRLFALLATSLLFGMIHGLPATWVPLTILAVVLAALVEVTGSILPAIVAHTAFNGLTVALLLLF